MLRGVSAARPLPPPWPLLTCLPSAFFWVCVQGLQLDVECAVDYVLGRADLNAQRIVLFGRSLGGAVAAHAAARRRPQVAGLVLENTFTRIVDLVPHKLPLLKPLVGPGK